MKRLIKFARSEKGFFTLMMVWFFTLMVMFIYEFHRDKDLFMRIDTLHARCNMCNNKFPKWKMMPLSRAAFICKNCYDEERRRNQRELWSLKEAQYKK